MLPRGDARKTSSQFRTRVRSPRCHGTRPIQLAFAIASGRIPDSPIRTAVPVVRNVGGAVDRYSSVISGGHPRRQVARFSSAIPCVAMMLLVCLFLAAALTVAAPQNTSDSANPNMAPASATTSPPAGDAAHDTSHDTAAAAHESAAGVSKDLSKAPDDVRKDTPGEVIKRGKALKFDVDLALVNATVTDPFNRLVTGLDPDNFRVFEDNVEQEVVSFSAEDVPISIGVIFDFSGSMANKAAKAREAAIQFFKTANPQDEFFLVSFNERAELTSSFTNSVEDLQSRLMLTAPKGRTALLDAIYLGLSEMRGAHNAKRALLILSDGGDNHSRYNEGDIKRLVKEADTQLYAIGIFDPIGYRNRTLEEGNGPSLLGDVTEMTGGRVFPVEKLEELPDIASKIGMELRNQYVLGYHPSNRTHDARWRKVKIKLRAPRGLPPLTVYSKTGYYAPSH
jgi:Ca-activated chloride channel family protein